MKNNSWHHERQRYFSNQKGSIYCVLQYDNYTDYLDSNHLLELIHDRTTFLHFVRYWYNYFRQVLNILRFEPTLRECVTIGE